MEILETTISEKIPEPTIKKRKNRLMSRLNHLVKYIREKGRVSVYDAANFLGITDIKYFERAYIERLLLMFEDIRYDGRYLYVEDLAPTLDKSIREPDDHQIKVKLIDEAHHREEWEGDQGSEGEELSRSRNRIHQHVKHDEW